MFVVTYLWCLFHPSDKFDLHETHKFGNNLKIVLQNVMFCKEKLLNFNSLRPGTGLHWSWMLVWSLMYNFLIWYFFFFFFFFLQKGHSFQILLCCKLDEFKN